MNNNKFPFSLQNIRLSSAFRIAFIYALFGAIWILLSDKLLALLVHDPAMMTRVSVYKGWAFVALTAWMLYLLIRNDCRKLHNAAALLKESKDRLRAIADTATDAIVLVDDRKRVVYWNLAAERMFGYTRAEVMGREIDFMVPDQYREAHDRGFGSFAETGEGALIGKTCEVSALRKDGGELPVELSISGIRLKGKWHAAGIIRDITERRSLENQLRHVQKMEALGTLTGGIAHDFNNILTAIIGFATLLQMKMARNDPLVVKVENILAAADRAANLVKSLLAFSRKEAIELRVVNLAEVVAGMQKLLNQLLQEDVELIISTAESALPVRADSGQIGQLLLNLASNARDAMPHGGAVSLRASLVDLDGEFVKTHGYGTPGRYALLTFSDNGVGMDEETRQRIFEPFYTTKEVGKGTGLGLSTSYGIVKQHKGFINCYSEPGKGTTFRVYLPIVEGKAEHPAAAPRTAAAGGTETILLAEDEALVRALESDVLRQYGYTVIEAVDGEDAVAKFREQGEAVQLAILDVIMPKKNGREAYEEIARLKPGIRVIFTSGYPAEVFGKEEFLGKGFSFISKPAFPHELLQKVREALEA